MESGTESEQEMSSRAVAQLRRCRAVELVSEGKTYDQVAKEVRYSNRGTPHRVVSQALSLRLAEDVDILRQLEADRVDASWPEVLGHTHRCEVFVNDWQRGGAAAPALVIVPGPALASVPAAMTMDCTA